MFPIIWYDLLLRKSSYLVAIFLNPSLHSSNINRKEWGKYICPNLVFRVRKNILSYFLHTFIQVGLISVLQSFLFLFSQCHATIHPHSASVLNSKSPLHSLCLQDNQMSVSHSRSQPPCHIVFTRSLSLPLSAPCYLWNANPPKYREMARR